MVRAGVMQTGPVNSCIQRASAVQMLCAAVTSLQLWPGIVRETKGRGTSTTEAATKQRLVQSVTD
jgi:hypothetical protein